MSGMSPARKPYPSDVSDEEWALVAPYLTLLREDAGQREHAFARGVQRVALRGQERLPVAADAPRPAALVCRVSAGPALAGGRLFRAAGRGSACGAAHGGRSGAGSERGRAR